MAASCRERVDVHCRSGASCLASRSWSPSTGDASKPGRHSRKCQVWGGPFCQVASMADARAAYPLELRPTTSSVALKCIAGEHGILTRCEVRDADPDLARPKAASLQLLRYFRISKSPGSEIIMAMQFSGKIWRCLMPFCMPDLILPPPAPPHGVCVPPVTPESGPPCPGANSQTH